MVTQRARRRSCCGSGRSGAGAVTRARSETLDRTCTSPEVRRLHLLHEGGVSIWLHTLSRELLESGEFERLARDSRRHRSPCPTRRSSRRRSTALTATTGSYRPRHHHPGGSPYRARPGHVGSGLSTTSPAAQRRSRPATATPASARRARRGGSGAPDHISATREACGPVAVETITTNAVAGLSLRRGEAVAAFVGQVSRWSSGSRARSEPMQTPALIKEAAALRLCRVSAAAQIVHGSGRPRVAPNS